MSYAEQLLARATLLDDTSGLGLMVAVILDGAAGAGLDPRVVPGLKIAIKALDDGAGIVGYDAGRQTDRRAASGYGSDTEFLEAIHDAAAAVRDHHAAAANLETEIRETIEDAQVSLANARKALAVAYAMPTANPCNGCHGHKQAAVDAAQKAINDAGNRIRICSTASDVLETLFEQVQVAHRALRQVPHDLGEVYELIYAFIAKGGKMPDPGRWIEGEGPSDARPASRARSAVGCPCCGGHLSQGIGLCRACGTCTSDPVLGPAHMGVPCTARVESTRPAAG